MNPTFGKLDGFQHIHTDEISWEGVQSIAIETESKYLQSELTVSCRSLLSLQPSRMKTKV